MKEAKKFLYLFFVDNSFFHGVTLGCTELPLMIKDEDLDTIIINTTQIHIASIIDAIKND